MLHFEAWLLLAWLSPLCQHHLHGDLPVFGSHFFPQILSVCSVTDCLCVYGVSPLSYTDNKWFLVPYSPLADG